MIRLPVDLPTIYRAYVIELAVSLDLIVARASDALRVIPDRVVIRYDHAAREHSIEIKGSVASILGLGRRGAPTHLDGRPPTEAAPAGGVLTALGTTKIPAGRFHHADHPGIGTQNDRPVWDGRSEVSTCSLHLVAGAGLNEERTADELYLEV